MPRAKNDESAVKYVLRILRTYPDRELAMDDLVAEQGDVPVHDRNALHNATSILVAKGAVERNIDPDLKRSYWAITAVGLKPDGGGGVIVGGGRNAPTMPVKEQEADKAPADAAASARRD